MSNVTVRYTPLGLLVPARRTCAAAALCMAAVLGPSPTQNAVANGETRTLTLHHAHTRESITVTFRRYGSYDQSALEKLNWFLRDWRKDEPVNMDPRLFDVVWETYRESGSSAPIRVVSAYRSPDTNAMLRRRSRAVAKHSQHTLGKAMDMHYEDVSMAKIREIGMRLQRGGVGYYPTAGTPFVHLDVGSVRSWPRMPREQLARLFPNGKTVHLPADGTPLEGYEAALAEIQSRGGSAASYADITGPRRSLWAVLFGGEDGEYEESTPARGRGANTRNTRGRVSAPQVAALSTTSASGDNASVYAVGGSAPMQQVDVTLTPARPARPQPMDEPAAAPKATAVASLAPLPMPKGAEDKPALKLADVPMPPRRPADLKNQLQLAAVPLPPVRPQMSVVADLSAPAQGLRTASAAAAFAPGAALRPGLPPAIASGADVATAKTPVAAAEKPLVARDKTASDFTVKLDSVAMTALISDIAAAPDKDKRSARVDTPSVQQSVDSRVIAGRLGAVQAVASGRFSGGLVRPNGAAFVSPGR